MLKHLNVSEQTLRETDDLIMARWLESVLGGKPDTVAKMFGRNVVGAIYFYDKMFMEPIDAVIFMALTGELWTYIPTGEAPEIIIPDGTYWTEGPCGTYVDLGMTVNLVRPKYIGVCTFNGAAPPPEEATDAEINFALSGGNYVGLEHVEPYGLIPGTWAYSGFGSIKAIDVGNFEPWDSSVHGKYKPNVRLVPQYDAINDAVVLQELNTLLDDLGLPRWPSLSEMLNDLEAVFGQEFWKNPLGLPLPKVTIIDTAGPEPEPLPEPETDSSLNNNRSRQINQYMRLNNGFRSRNKRNRRERKHKVERGLWSALNAFGAYSELGDAVNAIWKALPKDVQKEAFKRNGYRHLLWEQKLLYITANANQVDWGEAIPRVILGNIDDFVSAKLNRGASPYSRDWKTRAITRRAWNELHDDANMPEGPDPSVTRWLERNGWLEK